MNPYMSVMKTFVMMMGEFQAESLATEMANSITFFCLFAVFVVTIAIFLLNLLTGLAASDTKKIKYHSEEQSVVSRIRLIYKIESTLLQWYTFVEKWPKYTLLCPFINLQKSMIKNSSLFPDTSHKKRIHVSPNKGPNIAFEGDGQNEVEDGDDIGHVKQAHEGSKGRHLHILNICTKCSGHNTSCKMTSAIIGEATRIISKRSDSDVINMRENFSQIQDALKENESKLSKIEKRMGVFFKNKKLDAIKKKLENDKIQSKNKGSQKRK
jgi:hypothetical protein